MVIINFLFDDISISKGEIMGFLQNQAIDISEIRTETSTEPSPIGIGEDRCDIGFTKSRGKEIYNVTC